MRVLVCGGRNYKDKDHVFDVLNQLMCDTKEEIEIIHGAATGADTLAGLWARSHRLKCRSYPAKWKLYGPSAGPIRNREMIEREEPDLVLAFPGGIGTSDMIGQAAERGIEVRSV